MKLYKIEIQNFRGIKSLDLTIDDMTVLIGENNTCKTSILEALRLALNVGNCLF
jgi:putative ATP-dependent endonuclease of OLD family